MSADFEAVPQFESFGFSSIPFDFCGCGIEPKMPRIVKTNRRKNQNYEIENLDKMIKLPGHFDKLLELLPEETENGKFSKRSMICETKLILAHMPCKEWNKKKLFNFCSPGLFAMIFIL